ncbi:MAG: hypothetical protein NW214_11410 [Pseudanabaenaceae cyanobacterium bins.39]|nr:hypothetical protein [Pseudanabaenaceae cyanobacterium bins.39]
MLPADIIANKLIESFSQLNILQTNPVDRLEINQNSSVKPQTRNLNDRKIVSLVSYLTFPLINILAVFACFYLLKNLDFNVVESAYGCLGLIFCSSFLPYAQTHQENSLDFLMTASGYLFHLLWLITSSYRYLWVGMLALGFNLLVRMTLLVNLISVNIFTGISFYFFYLRHRDRINLNTLKLTNSPDTEDLTENPQPSHFNRFSGVLNTVFKYLAIALFIYGIAFGIDRFYQWLRFDDLTSNYTVIWAKQVKEIYPHLPKNFPFSNDFKTGFFGFLFSADRSLFLFNPLIIVTAYISIKNWHKISYQIRGLILSLIFLLLATICIYSSWFLWGGAGAWGSRYTTTSSQLLSLLAIPLAMKFPLKSKFEQLGFNVLVLISGLIQASAVILDANLELAQNLFRNSELIENNYPASQVSFTIGQRFINIWALMIGKFDQWNLRPPNLSPQESQDFTTIAFFPWRNASNLLSPNIVLVLQLIWIFLLIILIFLIYRLTRICKYSSPQ